jgi:hypothetical protein
MPDLPCLRRRQREERATLYMPAHPAKVSLLTAMGIGAFVAGVLIVPWGYRFPKARS